MMMTVWLASELHARVYVFVLKVSGVMSRLILGLIVFIGANCAIGDTNETNLYEIYLEHAEYANGGQIADNREKYFTKFYLSEVDVGDEKSLFLLSISKYIDKVDLNYQIINGGVGCLTINGFEENGGPVALHIEYKNRKREWLINYMYLDLLENQVDFENRAVCPDEVEERH